MNLWSMTFGVFQQFFVFCFLLLMENTLILYAHLKGYTVLNLEHIFLKQKISLEMSDAMFHNSVICIIIFSGLLDR